MPIAEPPAHNEVEVSVFGPGYGESILIHIGGGKWVVIDSCIDQRTRISSPISYLQNLGVAIQEDVKCVIATHWHDDHIRGLNQVVEKCTSAVFVCSDALGSSRFMELVSIYKERPMMKSTGVSEFIRIFDLLRNSGRRPKWAIANLPLFQQTVPLGNDKHLQVGIVALSPSDEAVFLSKLEIGRLMPGELSPKRSVIFQGPNESSVASIVQIGDNSILLGADLEVSNRPGLGWGGVLADSTIDKKRSGIFKIPHHGSKNAYSKEVLDRLLSDDPWSIVTPYRNGSVQLPTYDDMCRMADAPGEALITSDPNRIGKRKRPAAVQKTIRRTVRSIKYAQPPMGQVRIRGKIDDSCSVWNVQLFYSATSVASLLELNEPR